ncbi:unannotated protein [freshwater metagenome]|uniref:Unannotated protein n=1 Tax=freshwater metagenome TaxID=449393 RepID=A0A6J7NCX4_9ZZZZ|nr:hypothetical protein [Actinomycetota bacterium]
MSPWTRVVAAPVLAMLLIGSSACSSSEPEADASSKSTADAASPAASPAAQSGEPTEEQVESLVGRYAHYDVVAYQSTDMKTLIISYGFTDLSMKGGSLMATESFCHAEHRGDQPIETTISDAATSAIKPIAAKVDVSLRNGKLHLERPPTPTGIGIEFADPANDALPTDPNDPRTVDDDGDGNPGITVHVKVTEELQGDIYIARREIFQYEVTQQKNLSLIGTVTDNSEQLIIGASNQMFITRAEWIQVPDLNKSPIVLLPVEQSWDCAKLMEQSPQIFPAVPTVDW